MSMDGGRTNRSGYEASRGRTLLPGTLPLFLLLFLSTNALAQDGAIAGNVKDVASSAVLTAVQVDVFRPDRTIVGTDVTGANGTFRIAGIAAGTYDVRFTLPGWRTHTETGVVVAGGQVTSLSITMEEQLFTMNPITATVARGVEERLLEAPASVQVVGERSIRSRSPLSTTDYIQDLSGVDVITTGLQGNYFVTRGFNNIFSGAVMFLTDFRISRVPSLRANISHLNPTVNADIGRIEVVLGPASALYGPNTASGVVHIITTSPIDEPGVTFSVAGGPRNQGSSGVGPLAVEGNTKGVFQTQGRVALRASEKFGVKVSGGITTGTDFEFVDPVEAEQRALADACLADPTSPACDAFLPDTTPEELERIGVRNFDVDGWTLDVRADWRPTDDVEAVFSYGHTTSNSSIDLTGIGAAQVVDWGYDFWQARVNYNDLFGQVYFNKVNAGDTYLLRTGLPIVDRSSLFVAQLQNTSFFGDRQAFTYGVDLLRTSPKTDGTINGSFEGEDGITEVGGFVHSQTTLSEKLDLFLALRADRHSVLKDLVLSPRVAFVYKPVPTQAMRLTFNRAFSTPTTNNLFLDLLASIIPIPGTPFSYPVNTQGTGSTGFTFQRTGGAADFKSAFAPLIGQTSETFFATSTANLWALAVASVAAVNPDIGAVLQSLPVPTDEQVGNSTNTLDPGTASFVRDPRGAAGIQDIPEITNQITNTFEVGYKALLEDKLLIAVDLYYSRIEDFIGPLRVETPNTFLGGSSTTCQAAPTATPEQDGCLAERAADIAAYIGSFGVLPPEVVAQVAGLMAAAPLGVITPEQNTIDEASLLLTYRNFGDIDLWGADLAVQFQPTPEWVFGLAGSWISDDSFDAGGLPVALNAPIIKTTVSAGYNGRAGFSGQGRFRFVDGFPANSGVYVGPVDSYAVFDLQFGYDIPPAPGLSVQLDIQNLFDNSYQSFPGTPQLGRLSLFRLVYDTP